VGKLNNPVSRKRGRVVWLLYVLKFTIRDGKIAAVDLIPDPERIPPARPGGDPRLIALGRTFRHMLCLGAPQPIAGCGRFAIFAGQFARFRSYDKARRWLTMNYEQYGIDPQLVERLKKKAKKRPARERVKRLAEGVTKEDLQNEATVRKLIVRVSRTLSEPIPEEQTELMAHFIVAQQIDPNNALQLLKLYAMLHR
jgi:hypothetical protein